MKKMQISYIFIFLGFIITSIGITTKQPISFIIAIILFIIGLIKRTQELKKIL